MRLFFEISGDRQIERELLRIGERAGDASPAFDRVVDFFIEETALQFDSEGGHGGSVWKPIKDATIREKQAHGLDNGILRRTFALEDSLTNRSDPNMLTEISADELVWGSTLPYAGVHQNPKPGNPLPRRRPVEFNETARQQTVKIVQRYLLTGEVVW